MNDEARMTRLRLALAWQANDEGMTKPEFLGATVPFVIRHLLIVSSFVIRASSL